MEFLIGLLTVTCLFSFCLIVSYFYKNVKKDKKITPSKSDDAKIFYVTNIKKPKPKPKKTKPDVAIKGSYFTPSEFQRLYVDDDFNNDRN